MRHPRFPLSWSATVVLLVVNVVAFVVQNALERWSAFPLHSYLALSVEGLRHGFVWQLLTYQFLHGGWLHLLLNCWAIYVFGRAIEEALGGKKFLALYFSSGVMGGLFQTSLGVLVGGAFAAPVVGASAGAFGLVAAFAVLYPERPLMLLLFFIIPVSMRAKFLLLFSALLAVFGIVFPTDNIAHAAHLGGMLAGIAFVRYAAHWDWRWPRLRRIQRSPLRPVVTVSRPSSARWGPARGGADAELPPEEFLSREVDPILDKISAHGIQSLTERERRILETAREKMARR
ncbi:MAG TPA: rhomboid family intramembrane serine protease [Candidatus Paceibacterota bacterium]|nr:rhomboid family intramembrane serine protease [Verrucomicrobiota bacterium]HSA08778.1 rhomboid family intramembrane serine protease [Candidatus Paceibacterota bacterium]